MFRNVLFAALYGVLLPACGEEDDCARAPEVCNGLDDNCDGETDEEYGVDTPCAVGIGACQRQGVLICNPDSDATVCDAQPGDPIDEVQCNAADDDCDGSLDEGTSCIAFVSDREGGGVMIMQPDGNNPIHVRPSNRRITSDLAWSPTQPEIAFTYIAGADSAIAALDLMSGSERVIWAGAGATNSREPSWAPDGRRLAFTQYVHDRIGEIHVIDMVDFQITELTDNRDFQPDFSPDGTQIALVSRRNNNSKIYRIDANGGNFTRITNEAGDFEQPAWSPDGNQILHMYLDDVWVMNSDGSDRRNLTNTQGSDSSPRWSPDGTRIVFVTSRDGNDEIYVMDQDGGNPINLTQNPASDSNPDWSRVR